MPCTSCFFRVEDNAPDANDEADFDIPDTQAVSERFMWNMSSLADDEYRSLSDLLDSLPDPLKKHTAFCTKCARL